MGRMERKVMQQALIRVSEGKEAQLQVEKLGKVEMVD
jgi:hypothetical protein